MADLSLLFWNVAGKDLRQRVARLALSRAADVILLAENGTPNDDLVDELRIGGGSYHFVKDDASKLAVYTRLPVGAITTIRSLRPGMITLRRVALSGTPELLLVGVHLPGQLHWSRDDQTLFASRVAATISDYETTVGHTRTMVIGDFNMSPFDPGMAGAGALHAVMTKDLATRETREVSGEAEPMFYNPMWGCFGDRTQGAPGSYYYRSAKPLNYFWHLFDQILVRPSTANTLTEVGILDHDGQQSLLTAHGLPDVSHASDHLPLFARLRF